MGKSTHKQSAIERHYNSKVLMNTIQIQNCDCLVFLKQLEDNSVDLIATDPPYYKVKTIKWDNQWPNRLQYLKWMNQVFKEYARVLKPTGSLYVFANPYLGSHIELEVEQHFNVLNHIAWRKPSGKFNGCHRASLRKYFPQTERIIFAESLKRITFPYESVLNYLKLAIHEAKLTNKDINSLTKTSMSNHWLGRHQFSLIGEKHYLTLQKYAPKLTRPYAQLYSEFATLRRTRGRRVFNMDKQKPFTDVWDFKVVQPYKGKHPCEKPADLMEHIISTSSHEGDVVLDTFVGSGSTAKAAHKLNRNFIGCEFGSDEYSKVVSDLKEEGLQVN